MIRATLIRPLAAALLWVLTVLPAQTEPVAYRLDTTQSEVNFTYDFQGTPKQGTMPVQAARMRLDLDNVAASQVDVTLDANAAKAGFILATQTMKGPQVLDTENFPTIRFRSTSITGSLGGARVAGDLTLRGVTRPVTLDAGLFRQGGTPRTSRDKLVVLLTGTISRSAFGAGGFPGYVGDRIELRIVAAIEQ